MYFSLLMLLTTWICMDVTMPQSTLHMEVEEDAKTTQMLMNFETELRKVRNDSYIVH